MIVDGNVFPVARWSWFLRRMSNICHHPSGIPFIWVYWTVGWVDLILLDSKLGRFEWDWTLLSSESQYVFWGRQPMVLYCSSKLSSCCHPNLKKSQNCSFLYNFIFFFHTLSLTHSAVHPGSNTHSTQTLTHSHTHTHSTHSTHTLHTHLTHSQYTSHTHSTHTLHTHSTHALTHLTLTVRTYHKLTVHTPHTLTHPESVSQWQKSPGRKQTILFYNIFTRAEVFEHVNDVVWGCVSCSWYRSSRRRRRRRPRPGPPAPCPCPPEDRKSTLTYNWK